MSTSPAAEDGLSSETKTIRSMAASMQTSGDSTMPDQGQDELMQFALPPHLMRNLGDRSYDKRKNSAIEVENLVKQLQEQNDTVRIAAIVKTLGQDFACSTSANHRKGGLIGLAATAIGLMHDAHKYLDRLLPPVLHCFDDPESRVRYYACESLYNIAKVARGHILCYFNQIFDGLCKLFSDVDVDVKNGANLLDRLVKDIVTESESFDVDMFIPLLQKYIRMTNPYIRQLLVGWITVLDSVPDIDMLDWLPEFLDGLFNMLSDGNREIRQAADSALAEFLREIKQTSFVDYGSMVQILVSQCNSKQRFNRLTAVTWVHEFINLGRKQLVDFFAIILGAIMHCISDTEHEIRQIAERANNDLLQLVKSTPGQMNLMPLMEKLNIELVSDHVPTRMAALRWISMLLEKSPDQLEQHISGLLPTLLNTLSDVSDAVVLLDLEVIARISINESEFNRVLNAVIQLFRQDRQLLETRGSLIVRKLCVLLDAKSIYMVLADVLRKSSDQDPEFASVMVHSLNLILLTAAELAELRTILKRCFKLPKVNSRLTGASSPRRQVLGDAEDTEADFEVFATLFSSWCHNPIATFSLCLLAQAYDLSSELIAKFAEIEVTVGFLMQIDKLVQLLESPIFIHLRLQLLETDQPYHLPLMKSLYGLLMLLPQSVAYRTLRDRLTSVTSMATATSLSSTSAMEARRQEYRVSEGREQTYTKLLNEFERLQVSRAEASEESRTRNSLLHPHVVETLPSSNTASSRSETRTPVNQ